MSRFLAIALLLHIPLFAYPVLRLGQWLEWGAFFTTIIFIPVFFSQIFARRVLRNKTGRWAFVLRNCADFILGVAPIVLLLMVVMEMVLLTGLLSSYMAGVTVLLGSGIIVMKGVFDAFNPVVEQVNLRSDKITQAVRFVQISDVHIGSRSSRFLKQLVKKINQLDAEFLCITGDFIDQPGITLDQLAPLNDFNGPIFYCSGNHERYEDFEDILVRLRKLGVKVLQSQSEFLGGLQLIGIDDREDALRVKKELAHIDVSNKHYSILLYHRPVGLEACDENGVELMLSGHTHGGQIVPFNFIVNRVFERVTGLFTHGQSTLYVSQGTGTWGPVLRVGTKSEITLLSLIPE